ncbi:TSUP family transporter [Halobacteriovorax sp. HLS]|uniref:TSUP family transporter n=1 Tax=Halobacteriovorax sp. HLS TaxID=2234000 RepID=UPI000FDC8FCB|nr:TSUP family transporter [Halobacteriovorax sp. HLS]
MFYELEIYQYLIIFVGVFFAGLVDSIAGGGGLITIPLYISVGLPESLILGTNKSVSSIGTFSSITRFIRNKAIKWKEGSIAIVFSLTGAFIGARASKVLSSEYMIYILIVVLPLLLFLGKKINFNRDEVSEKLNNFQLFFRSALTGLCIGFYDGFFGPGTGTFLIIALFLFLRMNALNANATARVLNFTSNIASFIYFASAGSIAWKVTLIGAIGSILGNWIGSGLILTRSKDVIKPVFNFVLLILFIKCIHTLYTT